MYYSVCCVLQETILLESMFDVPGSDISTVIITHDVVEGRKAAEYIREQREPTPPLEDDTLYEQEEIKMHHS